MLKGKITKAERDALPGHFQSEYKPLVKDGVAQKDSAGNEIFLLDTPDMEHRDDITGLKTALESERQSNTERGQRITSLEAEKNQIAADLAAWKIKNPKATDEAIEAARQELITKHTGELEAANKKTEGYRNALDQALRIDAARAAILKQKGAPELLIPHVLSQTKFIENADGTFAVAVINEKGTPRIGDGQGNAMTLDQLVTEIRGNEVFGRAFEASTTGGSGANNTGGSGNGAGTNTLSATEKLKAARRTT